MTRLVSNSCFLLHQDRCWLCFPIMSPRHLHIQVHLLRLNCCNSLSHSNILLCSCLFRILLQRSPLHVFASHLFPPSSFLSSPFITSNISTLSSSKVLMVYTQAHLSQYTRDSAISSWLQIPILITTLSPFQLGTFVPPCFINS